MRRARLAGFSLLAVCALQSLSCAPSSVPVPATPLVDVRLNRLTTEYEVTGISVPEIRASITRAVSLEAGRSRYPGVTTWDLTWRYAGARTRTGGCSPNGVRVDLDIRFRYPVWTDSAAAPAAVRDEWNRYIIALKAHEGNHAAIAIRGANQLVRDLKDLVTPVCATLHSGAQQVVAKAVQQIRRESDRYDQSTRHGATEGATLQGPRPNE